MRALRPLEGLLADMNSGPRMDGAADASSFHVLDFSWDGFVPRLEAYDAGGCRVVLMPLDRLNMNVSEERRCIGRFEGGYIPCPGERQVRNLTQCRSCMGDRADMHMCVFEPRCAGDLCEHRDFCGRRHVVYLAAYGTFIKVGMTSAARVIRRGIEQGADAIVPVFLCSDRQGARRLERETSTRFQIPQDIRATRVAAQWTHPPSRDVSENIISTHRDRISSWKMTMDEEILYLDGYPIRSYPRSPPVVFPVAGHHCGEVLGVKGRFMIYRPQGGESRLLNLSDLPSRTISVGPTGPGISGIGVRERRWEQSSLDIRSDHTDYHPR